MAKDAAKSSEKWKRRAAEATQDYSDGIQNPSDDWAQATAAAADRYKDGVQKSIQRNAFSKGVARAGTQTWQQGALQKGPNRFAEGVAVAQQKYQSAIEPYNQVLQSIQYPQRFPKGDPRNIERVRAINKALRDKKESIA